MLREVKVELNEDVFLIKALTRACRLNVDTFRTRLPIRKGLLEIILSQLKIHFYDQKYLRTLYRAIFCTAYFGLFRIGELTSGDHPVKAVDVHIGHNKCKMMFILRSLKTHGKDTNP